MVIDSRPWRLTLRNPSSRGSAGTGLLHFCLTWHYGKNAAVGTCLGELSPKPVCTYSYVDQVNVRTKL